MTTKLFLVALLLTLPLAAAEKTLITGHVAHGGYGGPIVQFTQIGPNQTSGILVGGMGGWIIDHTFVIGGGGYGLSSDVQADWYNTGAEEPFYLNFGYGGLMLGYINNSDNLVHYEVTGILGGGGASYRIKNDYNSNNDGDGLFVAEPAVNLVLNVTPFFRIAAGASYRYVTGVNLEGLTSSDLSGVSGQIQLKFGSF